MNQFQKLLWTFAFSACYLIVGSRIARLAGVVVAIYFPPSSDLVYALYRNLLSPFIGVSIALPGAYLIYKVLKNA